MVAQSPRPAPASATATAPEPRGGLDRYFHITARRSTPSREVRGGLVTFFTMAYILALNPLIVGLQPDKNGLLISGQPKFDAAGHVIAANAATSMAMVAAGTALVAGVMTIVMGVVGRYPVGIATGLGLNALLAYTIVQQMTWAQAMGLVVWEGVLITALVLTGFRTAVFKAVPRSLRAAISVGIGLFVAFIGLVDGGVVRKPKGSPPVELGVGGSLIGWPILVFLIGLLLVVVLYQRHVKGSMLIAILAATVLALIIEGVAKLGSSVANPTGWMLNVPKLPGQLFAAPNFGTVGKVDLFGAFVRDGHFQPSVFFSVLMIVFSLVLTDFFDTMGTVVAIGAEAGILDEQGNPPHVSEILLVDAVAAIAGGAGGVSSNTAYIESASGVAEGARTGLASVVTGAAFLLAIFVSPWVNIVPSEAATPVLVFVGFLMMSQVKEIDWSELSEGIPAFFTIILMPFTYSITAGIGAGFILYTIMKLVAGKARQIHPLMAGIAVAFLIYFAQGLITGFLR